MPKIPDDMWKCPECGAGYDQKTGEGLTGDDCTTWEDAVALHGKNEVGPQEEYGWCECTNCRWSGTSKQVYRAAQERAKRKPCPHCKGSGWVNGEK